MHAPGVRGSPASVFRGVTKARSPGMTGTPVGRQGWEGTHSRGEGGQGRGQCFRRLIGGGGLGGAGCCLDWRERLECVDYTGEWSPSPAFQGQPT